MRRTCCKRMTSGTLLEDVAVEDNDGGNNYNVVWCAICCKERGLLLNEIIDGTRAEHEIDSPSPRDEGGAGENLLGKLYVIMKLEEK